MGRMILAGADQSAGGIADSRAEFRFGLKLRVECSVTLWSAAAERCMHDLAIPADELIDLIGPVEDPSIEDCLMVLALPASIPGCALLDVSLNKVRTGPTFGTFRNANTNGHLLSGTEHDDTPPA